MNEAPIPATRLDNAEVWDALEPRLKSLVSRNEFTLAEEVASFERSVAAAFGSVWAVGTSSGTSALVLALRAGLPSGSRVAVPANTFFATLAAVLSAGHIPVVIDHDEDYLLSVDALEGLEIDAVIPVHLYGLPVDMGPIMSLAASRSWWVLEDGSQAHGATIGGQSVGSFGHAAAFSAYPTKNLGAWGDAGFVTGSDPDLENRIRSLRQHGQSRPNTHDDIGGTERLDSIQAVVLEEKLRRLGEVIAQRRQVARWYEEGLIDTGLDLPGDRGDRCHTYHQYVVRVDERDDFRRHLASRGIGTSVHYPTPVHLQPAAAGRCEVPIPAVRAESWASQIVSLPLYGGMERGAVQRVCAAIGEFLR